MYRPGAVCPKDAVATVPAALTEVVDAATLLDASSNSALAALASPEPVTVTESLPVVGSMAVAGWAASLTERAERHR